MSMTVFTYLDYGIFKPVDVSSEDFERYVSLYNSNQEIDLPELEVLGVGDLSADSKLRVVINDSVVYFNPNDGSCDVSIYELPKEVPADWNAGLIHFSTLYFADPNPKIGWVFSINFG